MASDALIRINLDLQREVTTLPRLASSNVRSDDDASCSPNWRELIRQKGSKTVRIHPRGTTPVSALASRVEEIMRVHLARIGRLAEELLDGRLAFDRWPLRASAAMPK